MSTRTQVWLISLPLEKKNCANPNMCHSISVDIHPFVCVCVCLLLGEINYWHFAITHTHTQNKRILSSPTELFLYRYTLWIPTANNSSTRRAPFKNRFQKYYSTPRRLFKRKCTCILYITINVLISTHKHTQKGNFIVHLHWSENQQLEQNNSSW